MALNAPPRSLQLADTLGGVRYTLDDKPLFGGDTIALCFSGGWVVGRFEWSGEATDPPRFHCSIELEGGRVEPFAMPIPEGALVRRP